MHQVTSPTFKLIFCNLGCEHNYLHRFYNGKNAMKLLLNLREYVFQPGKGNSMKLC